MKAPTDVSDDVEYLKSTDGSWQDNATFSNLEPNMEYSFYMLLTASVKTGFGAITVKYNDSTAAGNYTIRVEIIAGDNYAATSTDITLAGTFTIREIAPTAALFDYTLLKPPRVPAQSA